MSQSPAQMVNSIRTKHGISIAQLEKEINVPRSTLNNTSVSNKYISIDTAYRLAKITGTTPQYWLYKQLDYIIEKKQYKHNCPDIKPLLDLSDTLVSEELFTGLVISNIIKELNITNNYLSKYIDLPSINYFYFYDKTCQTPIVTTSYMTALKLGKCFNTSAKYWLKIDLDNEIYIFNKYIADKQYIDELNKYIADKQYTDELNNIPMKYLIV